MAKVFNRARMTTATTGQGTVALGSAVARFQSFASAGVTNGDVVSYVLEDGASWEIGRGTYSLTGPTLARTTVIASSAGGTTKISLSGSAIVSLVPLKEDFDDKANAADLPVLASGTYTPTLTNSLNVAGSTASVCQYLRVGSVVTVSGAVTIDPTAAATATVLDMSLPIASSFSSVENCGGTACCDDFAGLVASIFGNPAGNTARLQFIGIHATDHGNRVWHFSFTYRII